MGKEYKKDIYIKIYIYIKIEYSAVYLKITLLNILQLK